MTVPDISPREEIYRAALTASRLFARSVDQPLTETFSQLATLLVDELGARLVTIGRLDREDLSLPLIASAGPAEEYARDLILSASPDSRMGNGPAGQVLRAGSPNVFRFPEAFPAEMSDWKEKARLHGICGSALAPIHTQDGLWGLLTVYRGENEIFSLDILPVLEGFVQDIGAFLDRRREYRELQVRRAFQGALEALQARFLSVPTEEEILQELVRILVVEEALPAAWVLVGGENAGDRDYSLPDPVSVSVEIRMVLKKIIENLVDRHGWRGETGGDLFPIFLELSDSFLAGLSLPSVKGFPVRSLMVFPLSYFPDHSPQTLLLAGFSSSHQPSEAVVELLSQVASSTRLALSQRRDRERLERYAAFYRAVSESSQLMARHPSPQHLFDSLCEILVKTTGLDLAFISLVEAGMKVRVVSSRGAAASFLEGAVFSIDPEDEGRCLIHSRTLQSEGVLSIPFLEGWLCSDAVRELAKPWNLKNTLTVAIRRDGKSIGIMGLISGEEGFFDVTLENLLEGLSRDITFSLEFQDRQDRLARMSSTDSLTGLSNRHDFSEKVSLALSRAREQGASLAVGILDLDGFKGWNDAFGHSEGDRLLKELAGHLGSLLPEGGLIARLGGDEFGFCLSGIPEAMKEMTDHLSMEILTTVRMVDRGLNLVTGSVGWAFYPAVGESFRDLLAHADEALYAAKNGGRNTVRYFGGEIAQALQRRIETHRTFPGALEKGELEFWLQPQIDCWSGRVEGAEMLVRWIQGDKVLPPGAFMTEVEKDPVLIRMLGVHALSQARDLRKRFRKTGLTLRISLNIGASHFLHGDFLDQVDQITGAEGGDGLVIEVTESAALEDMARTTRLVDDLKKRGFGVSLDDFGRGYSSLHYAADLSMSEIKLDSYFLRRFRTYTNAFAVVGSTLLLADLSGSRLVAEGIEFSEDLGLWLRMGGRWIQGYLLARPMPEENFLNWLSQPLPGAVTEMPPVYPVEDLPFLEYAFRPRHSYETMGHPEIDCPLDSWFDLRGLFYYHLPSWAKARDSHRALHQSDAKGRLSDVADSFCQAMETLRGEMDDYRLTISPPPESALPDTTLLKDPLKPGSQWG